MSKVHHDSTPSTIPGNNRRYCTGGGQTLKKKRDKKQNPACTKMTHRTFNDTVKQGEVEKNTTEGSGRGEDRVRSVGFNTDRINWEQQQQNENHRVKEKKKQKTKTQSPKMEKPAKLPEEQRLHRC